jgi:uncharacterized protein (UPF0332 family)
LSTWQELSQDCLRAAKKLLEEGLYRRSISSAYYAAYSAVTAGLLAKGVTFAHGWNNPAHDQVPELVLHNLGLPHNTRFQLNKAIRRLRIERENADYRPQVKLERNDALNCVHDALLILNIMEVEND